MLEETFLANHSKTNKQKRCSFKCSQVNHAAHCLWLWLKHPCSVAFIHRKVCRQCWFCFTGTEWCILYLIILASVPMSPDLCNTKKHAATLVYMSGISFSYLFPCTHLHRYAYQKLKDERIVREIIINTWRGTATPFLVHCLFASSYYMAAMRARPSRVSGHIDGDIVCRCSACRSGSFPIITVSRSFQTS